VIVAESWILDEFYTWSTAKPEFTVVYRLKPVTSDLDGGALTP
jgi:hypothetical protein